MMSQLVLKTTIRYGLLLILALPLFVSHDLMHYFITSKQFAFRLLLNGLCVLYLLLILREPSMRPKESWILVALIALTCTAIISALMGVDFANSLFGNYERMDGIINLTYLLMYFLILSHCLTTPRLWRVYLAVSVASALMVSIYGLLHPDAPRLSSTLGNPAFLASYLFFQVFFVLLLLVQSEQQWLRNLLYSVGLILFYTLLQTGTRGVVAGVVVGAISSIIYLGFYNRAFFQTKLFKVSLGIFLLLTLGLFLFQSHLLTNHFALARLLNSEFFHESAVTRATLWSIALKGIHEFPVFGWGINNFIYVYGQFYDPSLFEIERWFDSAHNVFLDWLVSGGLVGLLAYVALCCAPLYYLMSKKYGNQFSHSERAVLIGMLIGYLVQNMVSYDTISSYLCYIIALAYIHQRVSSALPARASVPAGSQLRHQMVRIYQKVGQPVMVLLTLTTIPLLYYLTIPSLLASHDAGVAHKLPDAQAQYLRLHQGLERRGLGTQELLEEITRVVLTMLPLDNISPDDKRYYLHRTEAEWHQWIKAKPNDPRPHFFLAKLSMASKNFQQAKKEIRIARSLSPQHQLFIIMQGSIESDLGNVNAAKRYYQEAYALDTRYRKPLELYESLNASNPNA